MTSNPRATARLRRWYLPLLVLGLVLLAALIYLLAQPQGVPQLAVEPARIDMGALPLGTPASFEILITNSGDGVLRFQQAPYIEVLEGC